nr:phage tail protein [uncultured Lachnoclostridium sp.]
MIEVSEQTIDRIHTILAGVEKADEKVLKPALARGLMAGKTAAGKMVRQTYHISAGDFNSRGYMRYNSVTKNGDGIIGSIEYSGGVIPLMKFKVSPSTPKKKTTPSAAVLKASSLVKFNRQKNVFVAQMKSGHIGIMERQKGTVSPATGKEKLKELLSPAVPQMVGNEKVMQNVEERVNEVINQRIEHEIERLLSKNGG